MSASFTLVGLRETQQERSGFNVWNLQVLRQARDLEHNKWPGAREPKSIWGRSHRNVTVFCFFLMGKPRSVGRGVKVFDFRMIFAGGGFEKTQATEREERCAASVFPAWPPGDHLASFVWLVLGAAWVLVICRVGA